MSRAPGRLDVMGGIADYSGSLVLQMPIHEACHVALQMQHPAEGGEHTSATGFTPYMFLETAWTEVWQQHQ